MSNIDLTSTAWQSEQQTVFRLQRDDCSSEVSNAVTIRIEVHRGATDDPVRLAAHIADLLNRYGRT